MFIVIQFNQSKHKIKLQLNLQQKTKLNSKKKDNI